MLSLSALNPFACVALVAAMRMNLLFTTYISRGNNFTLVYKNHIFFSKKLESTFCHLKNHVEKWQNTMLHNQFFYASQPIDVDRFAVHYNKSSTNTRRLLRADGKF